MKMLTAFSCIALSMPGPARAYETTHGNKRVSSIMVDDRDCIFFSLDGVPQADPFMPESPIFAVPKAHAHYEEIRAVLIAARTANLTISVATDGSLACGVPRVRVVWL